MVTESKAGDLLPHRPAVPSAPSPQGPQPLRPKASAMSPVPCEVPARLRRSSLRGNLLPPHIRAKDLDLQFPALGATRPRRDDRGSRHNQGKAIEGAAPRLYPVTEGAVASRADDVPAWVPGALSRFTPPPTPSRTRGSAASATEGRPAGTTDPAALSSSRWPLTVAAARFQRPGSDGRPLADAAERRPMGGGCQRSRARRAGGVQG